MADKYAATIKRNKVTIFLIIVGILLIAMGYYLLFADTKSSQFIQNIFRKPAQKTVKEYPTLDPALKKVVGSDDLKQTSQNYNLDVTDNTVRALITLNDESFILTPEYGKEEIRYGKYIQAMIKLDMIAKLAENPKIASITAAEKAPEPPITPLP